MKHTEIPVLVCGIVSLAIAGCIKGDEPTSPPPLGSIEWVSIHTENGTRMTVNGDGAVTWTPGDQIAVHTNFNSYKTCMVDVTNDLVPVPLSNTENRDGYAVYPATAVANNSSSTVQVTYPSSYDLTAYSETVLSSLTEAKVPMVALNSPGAALNFYHVGGLIRITMLDVPVGTKYIDVTVSGDSITGTATVVSPGTAEATSSFMSGAGNVVRFTLPGDNGMSTCRTVVLNLPVPCGTYTGLTMEARGTENELLSTRSDTTPRPITRANGSRYQHSFSKSVFTIYDYDGNATKQVVIAKTNLRVDNGVYSFHEHAWDRCYINDDTPIDLNHRDLFLISEIVNPGTLGPDWWDMLEDQYVGVALRSTSKTLEIDGYSWYVLDFTYWSRYLRRDGRADTLEGNTDLTAPNLSNNCGTAQVNGILGIIFLPDVFQDPNTNEYGSGSFRQYYDNIYNGDNWLAMEQAGAIFLPAAGIYIPETERIPGTSFIWEYAGWHIESGGYWTADYYTDAPDQLGKSGESVLSFRPTSYSSSPGFPDWDTNSPNGLGYSQNKYRCAVRLVHDLF